MRVFKQHLYNLYNKYFSNKFKEILAKQNDILAIQFLTPLSNYYLPWSQSSIRPSGLSAVLNEILINRRSCVVEFGGGISTFYIARLLRERSGHLYTIEHEDIWANFLKEKLKEEGLDSCVSIILAPLASTKLGLKGNYWYNTDIIKNNLSNGKIELLLVDGPPAYTEKIKYARYPAVPFMQQFMADDYTIILDDIDRAGEQEILQRWEDFLQIKFDVRLLEGNIAIGRSKPFFTL